MTLYSTIADYMNVPENVVKKIAEIKESDNKISFENVARKIKRELDYILDKEDVKNIWNNIKSMVADQKSVLEEINDAIDEKPKYDFEDNHYILYAKDKVKGVTEQFKIPVEVVDQIFNDFSRYGANMSGQAVMNKYSLKPKVWNLIKSHIGLYKDSHILSPMSMDKATEEGNIEEVIHEASYKNFEDKYKSKYKEAHHNILEKEVKNLAKIVGTLDGFIEYISPKLNILPIEFKKVKKLKSNENKPVYVFGDKHF